MGWREYIKSVNASIYGALVWFSQFCLFSNPNQYALFWKSIKSQFNKTKLYIGRLETFLRYFWPLVSINSPFQESWPFFFFNYIFKSITVHTSFLVNFNFFFFKYFYVVVAIVFWFKSCSISTVTLVFFSLFLW